MCTGRLQFHQETVNFLSWNTLRNYTHKRTTQSMKRMIMIGRIQQSHRPLRLFKTIDWVRRRLNVCPIEGTILGKIIRSWICGIYTYYIFIKLGVIHRCDVKLIQSEVSQIVTWDASSKLQIKTRAQSIHDTKRA